MNKALSFAVSGLLAGCTFAPGAGFSTLESVALEGTVASDTLLLDDGRSVVIDEATFGPSAYVLETLSSSGGGGGGTFDPAAPPDGFSLCHGGHCHADDGSLWSYEEIEQWLAGDAATWVEVLRVDNPDLSDGTLDVVADLLGDEAVTFAEPQDLSAGNLGRVRVEGQLVLVGTLVGGDEDVLFEGDLDLDLSGAVAVNVDRDLAPTFSLDLAWKLPWDLLGGVVLPEPVEGVLRLQDSEEAAAVVSGNAAATSLEVTLIEG